MISGNPLRATGGRTAERNACAAQCAAGNHHYYVAHKKHESFYGLHKPMKHFRSKFWQLWSAHQESVYSSTHGDCLQHTEALSSNCIPASAVHPPVALKGLADITTPLKGKWHVLSFQIAAIFLIQCASLNYLFQF